MTSTDIIETEEQNIKAAQSVINEPPSLPLEPEPFKVVTINEVQDDA